MVRQIILTGFVVILPVGVLGQGRGAMVAVPRAAAVAPRVVMPAARTGRIGTARSRTSIPVVHTTRRVGTRVRFADNRMNIRPDCSSAPGFGFDAVHQAAVCGPGTAGFQRGGFSIPFFFPFFDGGFSLPGTVAAIDDAPEAEGARQEATEAEIRDLRRRYRALQSQSMTAPAAAPAPLVEAASTVPGESDQFVFVRRDGTVFFAVAYAWENGTLRYVTGEGLRHTVTEDTLDLDATRQFNEQRGLSFRLPA